MTRLRMIVALLVWLSIGLAADVARSHRVAVWIDLPEIVLRGPYAWAAALVWGSRCRLEPSTSVERQHAPDGCGAAALRALLGRREPAPPQDLLWSICRRPGGGTTLGVLARAARCFGRRSELVWDPCLERIAAPAIVHLKRGHFVVLSRRGSHCAWVLDPSYGRLRLPWRVLRDAASGAALVFPELDGPVRVSRGARMEVAS